MTFFSRSGFVYPTIKIFVGSIALLYVVVPLVLYFVPHIHVHLIFLNYVKSPFVNYSDPNALGVKSDSRNFYLKVEDDVLLGVWQILPANIKAKSDEEFERALQDSQAPIIVYNHGNSYSRSMIHRIKLYNILAEAGYHVISYDYRGYGDSTGHATEQGLISDSLSVYEWAFKRAGSTPIFMWGHSLGTAISTGAVNKLCVKGECPYGLILEAPFNNLKEIVRHHPLTSAFRWLPWFEEVFVYPPVRYGLRMDTDERIKIVKCPVLILHAQDDFIIPFHLAKTLSDGAKKAGVDVSFVEFDHPLGYGHKYICNAPELPDIVYEFTNRCLSTKRDSL